MNNILNQLAQTLHISNETIQNVTNNYPQLREQFIKWSDLQMNIEALNNLATISGIVVLLAFVIWAFTHVEKIVFVIWAFTHVEKIVKVEKFMKYAIVFSIIVAVAAETGIFYLRKSQLHQAPEITAIMKLVETKK